MLLIAFRLKWANTFEGIRGAEAMYRQCCWRLLMIPKLNTDTPYTRSAIATGGTINLGYYYAALEIARQQPDWLVVICSRSDPERAVDKVRAFAGEWAARNRPPIQALLLNAGLHFPSKTATNAEGVEATFAINHVGHALLFRLLCSARVVVTSSGTHDPATQSGMPDAAYTTAAGLARPPAANYTNSKLANLLWAYALQRRLGARAPGTAAARLEALGRGAGKRYEGPREIPSSVASYNPAKRDDPWHWTVNHVAWGEAEAARFEAFS
ncbi:dehydrogenase/reductase [Durotheca rogersii]|uniref:dehydrogenase/reductase n=1 Tax=Durotheca rogersii TaxID=419775 RepID=UPI00221E8949|nr:dehydrogenase/reductase [Durotheca rogersii]KAI5865700.1 dehydrogenase/reductase [Durotheca rogersii]